MINLKQKRRKKTKKSFSNSQNSWKTYVSSFKLNQNLIMKRIRLSHQEDMESKYFRKIFHFQNTGNWRLPQRAYNAPKFEVPELKDLKRQLNDVKGKLSQFDLAKWSLHTRNRDVAGFVIGTLRKKIKPELLTQAWCKFYELASTFPLVLSNEDGVFTSLHLCEAPGAFICALNHYLFTNYPQTNWKWIANTLNPDYEGNSASDMIADARLICYTRDRWQLGSDLTGDIQKYYNHCEIVDSITKEGKLSLVTADGSIDCMIDPGEQEKLVEFLHYCETMTALAVLDKGGSLVLKIFTIFEESTICLMYLLNCIFDKVSVFKPCTSKSGNSEIYVVCNGFHGYNIIFGSLWDTLMEPYKNGGFKEDTSMFPLEDIPYSFKIQLISCCSDFFLERQINVIEENIYYFLYPDPSVNPFLHKLKIEIANLYVKKYKLAPIPQHRKIVPYQNIHERMCTTDICQFQSSLGNYIFSFKNYCCDKYVKITYGKRIDSVNNSKFISSECLNGLKKCCLKKKVQNNPSLFRLVQNCMIETTIVINGSKFDLVPHYKYQRELFSELFFAIEQRKHIVLLNVYFHTHFLAALWCIVASLFEVVYFGPGWIVFYKPLGIKLPSVKSIFDEIRGAYSSSSNKTISVDIIYIFNPEVFESDLNFVPSILNICNTTCLPS